MTFRVIDVYSKAYWTGGSPWWSAWSLDVRLARTFPSFAAAVETARRECSADPHDYAIVSEAPTWERLSA